MLKFKRHHQLLIVLTVGAIVAWSVWTFVLLPRSETPNLPQPNPPAAAVPSNPNP